LHFRFITGQYLLQYQRQAPTIEQEVVMRPDELHACFAQLYESQTHQGSLFQIKALSTVSQQEGFQVSFLLLGGAATPIQHTQR
jgi:hypothetical protein